MMSFYLALAVLASCLIDDGRYLSMTGCYVVALTSQATQRLFFHGHALSAKRLCERPDVMYTFIRGLTSFVALKQPWSRTRS